MILSICIPAYNRPQTLLRLLYSIDESAATDIEVVICEDFSPKRVEIRKAVEEFKNNSKLNVTYIENNINLGYDKNLRELILHAKGDFIMYMGDDDYIITESLLEFIEFLKENKDVGYVLKNWVCLHENGWKEPFNYFKERKFFPPGEDAMVSLFRLSTFVSGFTFKREYSLPYLTSNFDSTLLYQIYLLSELTLKYPSVYYEKPLIIQTKLKADVPHFGSSEVEKKTYTPGVITIQNSINFLLGYFKISEFIDKKYNLRTSDRIRKDLSKFSYSYFLLHRDKGIKQFVKYYRLLTNEVGINKTLHFSVYFIGLLLLGAKNCNTLIYNIKKILKKTPAK